ncbi:hypothetical protein HKK74_03860 [Actinomadura alba]|uniref:DUF7617 domain-containing protein n=2 Tax=Actinomadura alba TaxID=406431 RepID=A0ABR7LIM2_9ACTN|nr:hypothetical protein [Actinomadura alba]
MGSLTTTGMLIMGAMIGLAATSAPAADVSALQKSAQNVTHPGSDPADHSDVINWVVGYTGNGSESPAPATITDAIDPNAQTYVPDSLRVPPGWTPSWSTDGNTFQDTDTGTATTAVRASHPSARQGGTDLGSPLLPPVRAVNAATGGDGFTPILYRGNGRVEAWSTFHHSNAPAAVLVCTDLSTGQLCSGGPWPKPLNTAAGPLGSGATSDISTTLTPQYVLDPDRPGVVYYAALSASAAGVGCLDMAARANCGFFPLVNRGGSPSSVNGLAGLVETGGDLYGVATTGQLLCLDMASRTPCAGQPYDPVVTPNNDQPGAGHIDYQGSMTVAGGKVFASSSPLSSSTGAHPTALGCFDPATQDSCAGWNTPRTVGAVGQYTYSAYTAYDTAGAAVGACATLTSGPVQTGCFTIDGSALAAPNAFGSVPAGVLVFNPETFTGGDGHRRSYFAIWGGSVPGAAVCYDWTAAAPCTGFPAIATHPNVNGGQTRDYGYAWDATTECMFGLGDAGVLFSLDPATGKSPCLRSGSAVRLTPSNFYCDGGTGHVQGYRNARLANIDMANVHLGQSTVKVTGTDGATITTPGLAADGTVDLSGVSVAAHPSISVEVHLVLNDGGDFTGDNRPELVVTFDGDPPQVCFKTTISEKCTVTSVSNTATGSDSTGALTSNTVNLKVAPGPLCQPKVTVNKEVCASTLASKCGPGGGGKWVKETPVGLLGVLGTAYWRITVTNAGPVGIEKATLDDHVAPSCENAAGTFTLAANQSKQFYCSTFLLVLPLKNTVTASFKPVNSPHGTSPTTTKPSSAIACGLVLCILNK